MKFHNMTNVSRAEIYSMFKFILKLHLLCMCVWMHMYVCHPPWHTCGGEDNFQESFLSVHHVGSWDWTHITSWVAMPLPLEPSC